MHSYNSMARAHTVSVLFVFVVYCVFSYFEWYERYVAADAEMVDIAERVTACLHTIHDRPACSTRVMRNNETITCTKPWDFDNTLCMIDHAKSRATLRLGYRYDSAMIRRQTASDIQRWFGAGAIVLGATIVLILDADRVPEPTVNDDELKTPLLTPEAAV